jgi:hypothetical protein
LNEPRIAGGVFDREAAAEYQTGWNRGISEDNLFARPIGIRIRQPESWLARARFSSALFLSASAALNYSEQEVS